MSGLGEWFLDGDGVGGLEASSSWKRRTSEDWALRRQRSSLVMEAATERGSNDGLGLWVLVITLTVRGQRQEDSGKREDAGQTASALVGED